VSQNPNVTIEDVRAAGYCVSGARTWFRQHGLSFRDFMREGVPISTLEATGDAIALRMCEVKRGGPSHG
jgi:hypothetical protein